jgi:hypothetical protein
MEGHRSTGQSPQWAVLPMDEEVVVWAIPVQFLLLNECSSYNLSDVYEPLLLSLNLYKHRLNVTYMHMQPYNSTISSVSMCRATLLFLVFVVQVFAVIIGNVHPSSFLHVIHYNVNKTFMSALEIKLI